MFKFYNGTLKANNLTVELLGVTTRFNGTVYYVKHVTTKNVNSPTLLVESI